MTAQLLGRLSPCLSPLLLVLLPGAVMADESFSDHSLANPCHAADTAWDGSCTVAGMWSLRVTALQYAEVGCALLVQPAAFVRFNIGPSSGAVASSEPQPAEQCFKKCAANPDLTPRFRSGIFAADTHNCFCARQKTHNPPMNIGSTCLIRAHM